MALTPKDAVLFDLDGTLLNTFDFIYGAFGHALRTHGAPELTREQIAALIAVNVRKWQSSKLLLDVLPKLVDGPLSDTSQDVALQPVQKCGRGV